MKRTILVLVCLTVSVIAYTQVVPYYAEVYNEKTGELEYKVWVAANGNFRQELPSGDVTIFHANTQTAYSLDLRNKTYRTVPVSDISRIGGGGNIRGEYIGDELIEGKMCQHYFYAGGGGQWHEWIYQPIDTWIRYLDGLYETTGSISIKRNIVTGSQSPSLFEIPRDFTAMSVPSVDALEGMLNTLNDPNMTQEERLQNMMRLLGR